jgi:proton-coupled amino acid transporter
MYSFEGIGVILPLENQMKEPKKMVATFGTINISMTLCAFMYVIMGFLGYWHWKDEVIEGSITLNLPKFDW